jgi:hypothetical protein
MQQMGLALLRNIAKVLHKVETYQTQFDYFLAAATRACVLLAPYHRDINKHGTNFLQFDFIWTAFLNIPQSSSQCCNFPTILVASMQCSICTNQQDSQGRFSPTFLEQGQILQSKEDSDFLTACVGTNS